MKTRNPILFTIPMLLLVSAPGLCASVESLVNSDLATTIDSSCIIRKTDDYDFGWRLTQNSEKFFRLCLDTNKMRPARILQDTKAEMSFAGFYHKGEFWIANWKKSNKPKVQFFGIHFDSGVPFVVAGHTELHFSFDEPIQLKSIIGDKQEQVKDVIISWEASFPKDVHYDIFTGIPSNFALVGRVLSLEARIPENLLEDGRLRATEVYDLKLSELQSKVLFEESISESSVLGFRKFYRTILKNCTSQIFDLIDKTLRLTTPEAMTDQPAFQTEISFDPIIGPSRQALVDRNLIAESTEPKDLEKLLRKSHSFPTKAKK